MRKSLFFTAPHNKGAFCFTKQKGGQNIIGTPQLPNHYPPPEPKFLESCVKLRAGLAIFCRVCYTNGASLNVEN